MDLLSNTGKETANTATLLSFLKVNLHSCIVSCSVAEPAEPKFLWDLELEPKIILINIFFSQLSFEDARMK